MKHPLLIIIFIYSNFSGNGIMKLYDDVQTCEYKDVHVLWEILRLEMGIQTPRSSRRSIYRLPTWLDRSNRENRIIT